jgi:hypothetical protein
MTAEEFMGEILMAASGHTSTFVDTYADAIARERRTFDSYRFFLKWGEPGNIVSENLRSGAVMRCRDIQNGVVAALFLERPVTSFSAEVVRRMLQVLGKQESSALILIEPRLSQSVLVREAMATR